LKKGSSMSYSKPQNGYNRNGRQAKGYDRDKARYDGRFKGNGNGRHQGNGHGKQKSPRQRDEEGQKPAYEVSMGRVRVTVWINEGEHGPYYLANVVCRFLDQDGVWQSGTRFGRDELCVVQAACQMALNFMNEHKLQREPGEDREEEDNRGDAWEEPGDGQASY
jgi:hypothetical protein